MNTNKPKLAGLIAFGLAMALAVPVLADRVNCATATADHDVAICSTPELSQLDERMAAEATQALHRAPVIETFHEQQAAWRSGLASCGANVDCLIESYTARLEQLSGLTSPSETAEPPDLDSSLPAEAEPPAPTVEEPAMAPPSGAEAEAAGNGGQSVGLSAKTLMYGALMLAAAVAIVAGVVLLIVGIRRLTAASADRYGWNVFLNWWNILHLVGVVLGFVVGFFINPAIGAIIFLACWLVMLVVNIKHTNILFGLVITLIQPLFVVALWVIFGMSANRRQTKT